MSEDVYRERAQLVALVASLHPSVRAYSDPDEPEWSVVYVDSPAGQLSWHIAESDIDLFTHVPLVDAGDPGSIWDNHTTEEKYRRVAELTKSREPSPKQEPGGALIEILEKDATTQETGGNSVVVPNEVRINGTPLLVADKPITIHEIEIPARTGSRASDLAMVTLTLCARRVTIAAEGDLPDSTESA